MLSTDKVADAVAYNFRKAHSVGWPKQYKPVSSALGLGLKEPSPAEFAIAVFQWQSSQKPSISPDGKLGPTTWQRMRSASGSGGISKAPTWITQTGFAAPAPLGAGPLWLRYAQAEMQEWNRHISQMNKSDAKKAESGMARDEEYFEASPYFGGRVKPRGTRPSNKSRRDWCAAFANWCLHTAGYSHTGSAGAHSFIVRRLWRFEALQEPKQGCICVLGNGTKGNHVAFIWKTKNLPINPGGDVKISAGRKLEILGGNQSQRISVMNEKRKMLASRGYNGIVSPYLWPLRGPANCNHEPDTSQAHFCGQIHSD